MSGARFALATFPRPPSQGGEVGCCSNHSMFSIDFSIRIGVSVLGFVIVCEGMTVWT